jgi:hypothetical protein
MNTLEVIGGLGHYVNNSVTGVRVAYGLEAEYAAKGTPQKVVTQDGVTQSQIYLLAGLSRLEALAEEEPLRVDIIQLKSIVSVRDNWDTGEGLDRINVAYRAIRIKHEKTLREQAAKVLTVEELERIGYEQYENTLGIKSVHEAARDALVKESESFHRHLKEKSLDS